MIASSEGKAIFEARSDVARSIAKDDLIVEDLDLEKMVY